MAPSCFILGDPAVIPHELAPRLLQRQGWCQQDRLTPSGRASFPVAACTRVQTHTVHLDERGSLERWSRGP